MLEEAKQKKLEEERLAKVELVRLEDEESKLRPWKTNFEDNLTNAFNLMIEDSDWHKYSFCEEGYINVRKEKDLNGFIYDFREKCENNNFIANFKLLEKNLQEEINQFDYSQIHYYNLSKLLIEGKAGLDLKKIEYSLRYLNSIMELEKMKIESVTRYFVENFEHCKKLFLEELLKKNKEREDELELNVEWANKNSEIKLAFWINSSEGKFRETFTKFKMMNIKIKGIPKVIVSEENIIRFFWIKNDIRELQRKEYCPYISVGGVFFLDKIFHPKKGLHNKKWEIREMIGNKYLNKEMTTSKLNLFFQIDIPKNLYLKDLETLNIGKYNEETCKWVFDGFEFPKYDKDNGYFEFYANELAIFSLLLERKIFFPYKSWYLRCINHTTAILDLETPRLSFCFEIGIKISSTKKKDSEPLYNGYVKLINNNDSEFAHFVNKEMNYDEMIIEMRNCGILLTPDEQDLMSIGLSIKNYEATDRALNDIIMACRQYAIKSHSMNQSINNGIVLTKFKPNLEYDFKFFDDEEKDWFEVGWFFNKSTIGKVVHEKVEEEKSPTIDADNVNVNINSSDPAVVKEEKTVINFRSTIETVKEYF